MGLLSQKFAELRETVRKGPPGNDTDKAVDLLIVAEGYAMSAIEISRTDYEGCVNLSPERKAL